ncbi:DUF2029 domain-containing protein [Natronosporangium hydrolyticum]|uniref:DUF2029 domain-containing protein n=2 Tax=Natronosporangium hydrolyticum TaxID=2811111 RepID=A0A895YP09_9ACTN|nr:glycosyltransferase 87 family protein [Natronosporangium hydrolyticum]QSB17023.1 DUF2029 domain-containing protein [Natronosporangium hydrolyticum]
MFGRRYSFFDMRIYHGAVEWWLDGNELYSFIAPNTTLGFTYPPFAALAMLPMGGMSPVTAGWVNVIASVAALAFVLAVMLVPIADRCGWPRWAVIGAAMPLALALEPSRETLGFGQVNLLLFALIVADLVALRWRATGGGASARSGGRLARWFYSGAWAGAGIGLATAVKLTPGLFILYLIFARQWRTAAVASGTFAGASLAAAVVAPRESWLFFTDVLWQTDRVGAADFTPNQALSGILARLHDSPEAPTLLWLAFAALSCAVGLSRAVSAHREGDELTAFTLVGLASTVISPISWTHHLVFVIPAVVILMDTALRRRAAHRRLGVVSSLTGLRHASAAVAIYLLFVLSPIWWVRHRLPEGSHYDSGLWGVLAENSLALGVILLMALLPWRSGADHFRAEGLGYANRAVTSGR